MDRKVRFPFLVGYGPLDQFESWGTIAELPAWLQAYELRLRKGYKLDWKRELVIAHLVKQKIPEVDTDGLWENTLPEIAASEEEVQALEARLGYELDSQHRDFLLHANGWRAFKNDIDVFGASDFTSGPRAVRAADLIEALEPFKEQYGFHKSELLPIAVSSDDIDIMLMTRPDTATPGRVLWLAGGLVETFSGFDDWFLAMVDYNRLNYQYLVDRHSR